MGYYNDGSWTTPTPSSSPTGPFGGSVNPNAFQANPLFGGGSAYYDTANGGQIGYEQYVNQLTGQGGADAGGKFGNYLRQRFNTENNQYGAAQGKDPSLSFTNFLQGQTPNLQQQYIGQNPYDKGEQGQKALKWL